MGLTPNNVQRIELLGDEEASLIVSCYMTKSLLRVLILLPFLVFFQFYYWSGELALLIEPKDGRQVNRNLPKPLCADCREAVSKSPLIRLDYESLNETITSSTLNKAAHVNGTFGYVHDVTSLRKTSPTLTPNRSYCERNDSSYRVLTERVILAPPPEYPVSILCFVYTLSTAQSRVQRIRETWGQKCDGFFAASNITIPSLDTVSIVHEGPEKYKNMWQKVRSMWNYVYMNYYNDYDFFHIGGDDLYLILENLRYYLGSEEIQAAQYDPDMLPPPGINMQRPLFLGHRLARQGNKSDLFHSGGSGYTLNKAALKLVVTRGFPKYFQHEKRAAEDVYMAKTLREFNVVPYNTRDENGGERYYPFPPGHALDWEVAKAHRYDWYKKFQMGIKEGRCNE